MRTVWLSGGFAILVFLAAVETASAAVSGLQLVASGLRFADLRTQPHRAIATGCSLSKTAFRSKAKTQTRRFAS